MARPPFIDTQRLWRLECPEGFQQECLRPESLWALPGDEDGAAERLIEVVGLPRGKCKWQLVNPPGDTAGPLRTNFLADLSIARLCVTIDAGVGKTTALRQAEWVRQTGVHSDCLAVRVDFAELPGSVDMILGSSDRHAEDPVNTPLLIRMLKRSERLGDWPGGQLRGLIERLVRRGRFSLLVDSLDQSATLSDARASCRALCDFLARYPEVRCVVSGRPYAIRRYWDELFDVHSGQAAWQFVKVDVFTKVEAERYVGAERLACLQRLGADVISIPRSLEMIQDIPTDSLAGLRTKSDVYYRSVKGLLQRGLRHQAREVGLSEAASWKLFSLLAFEMLRAGFRANLAGIGTGRRDAFLDQVWARQEAVLRSRPLLIGSPSELDDNLGRLLAVNEHLVDPVLAGREHPEVVHFYWRNQALMDMFAALWITRYAQNQEDYDWFGQQLGAEASRELCQLAVEMPLERVALGEPKRDSNLNYVKALSVVYGIKCASVERLTVTAADEEQRVDMDRGSSNTSRSGDEGSRSVPGGVGRWSEWIYRSWPNVLQLGRFLDGSDWDDEALRAGTLIAQRFAWEGAGGAGGEEQAIAVNEDSVFVARQLVLRFLGEYPSILRVGSASSGFLVARELEDGFRRIPPDETCSREFLVHWRDGAKVVLDPFLMNGSPVTNAQYELFDGSHREKHDQYSGEDKCPVLEVTWYDAFCCSLWSHSRLPTEAEWEYACLAGSSGTYCFGDEESELGKYAWYSDNSGNKTHPVCEKLANFWGLYDVHGNVWEWCDSWYDEGSYRVNRGGSWIIGASYCRASYRSRDEPGRRDGNLGFRLLRSVS